MLLFADGSTMIFLTLYFRFISKYWLWAQLFFIIFSTVAFFLSCLAPESPKYLYSYKKYNDARRSIETIAKYNRKQVGKYEFDTEHKENLKRGIISPIWREPEGDSMNKSSRDGINKTVTSP